MKKYKGLIFVAVAAALWGTSGYSVKNLSETGLSEIGIVFGRSVFACFMLGVYLALFDRKAFAIKPKDIWLFALIGIASITFFNYCYFTAMRVVGISTAAVLLYTAPIFVLIISVLFLGEKLNVIKILCCLFAVVGCALVSGFAGTMPAIGTVGLALGLGSAFGYSLYGIFGSMLLKRGYSTMTITFYAFLFSLIGCAIVSIKNLPAFFGTVATGGRSIIFLVVLALINTIIPYILYSEGLKTVAPTVAVIIATVEPVVATVLDMTVYKKFPDIFGYSGIAIILSSILILNLFGKGEKRNETEK